jgi:Zn-dependent protease with chaperone function
MKNTMKLFPSLLAALIVVTPYVYAEESANSVYQQEFEAFKNNPVYKPIFDKDAPIVLSAIHQEIEIYKQLSFIQRFARSLILAQDVVIVTPEGMPKLYGYVQGLCKEHSITMPTVFITRNKGVFNAFAQKLLWSTGAIVIERKLLKESSAKELEAVVAHELGHIKYNHVNKTLGISLASYVGSHMLLKQFTPHVQSKGLVAFVLSSYLTPLIINKRFEKQADEFAYAATNNGKGLTEFFEHLQRKEKTYNDHFALTYNTLQDNKSDVGYINYLSLMLSYYLAKGGNTINNAYKWIYYNTPLGAHPSPEDRLKAIQEYQAQ